MQQVLKMDKEDYLPCLFDEHSDGTPDWIQEKNCPRAKDSIIRMMKEKERKRTWLTYLINDFLILVLDK